MLLSYSLYQICSESESVLDSILYSPMGIGHSLGFDGWLLKRYPSAIHQVLERIIYRIVLFCSCFLGWLVVSQWGTL